MQEHRLKNSW